MLDDIPEEKPERILLEHAVILFPIFFGRQEEVLGRLSLVYPESPPPQENIDGRRKTVERLPKPPDLFPKRDKLLERFVVEYRHRSYLFDLPGKQQDNA